MLEMGQSLKTLGKSLINDIPDSGKDIDQTTKRDSHKGNSCITNDKENNKIYTMGQK